MRHTQNLTFQEYMRIFIAVIVLNVVLEIIGYQGLGHWLYGYLWDTGKSNDWVIHVIWLSVVNAPVMFWWVVRQLKTERMYSAKLDDWQGEFQSLFYHNSEGIVSFDTEGNITNANPAIEKMIGCSIEEIKMLHRLDFLPVEKQGVAQTHFHKALAGEPQEFENTLIHKDGHAIHVQSRNIPIYRNGTVVGVYAILKNITDHKRYEHEIWTMAHYDQLTGLANRHQFRLAAEMALAQATEQSCGMGVLFVDLDRFKNINDNLGHDIGDQALTAIAERMSSCVRSENVLARMGGDEFAVLIPQMKNIDQAKAIADRLQEVIRLPLVVEQYEFYLTSSIGISVYPQNGESVKDLLKSADTAMYDAKRLGKNTTCVHTSSANEDSYWRLKLESDLRKALDEQSTELYVEYQPQVSINTGSIFGAEALARWQHPILGSIEPREFIPLAENTGLIANLGEHVTRVVCQQIGTWKKQHPGFSLPIAINISAIQLQESNFVLRLVALLREYSVPTSSIRIEVTESSLGEDEQLMVNQLTLLREFGFQIFVDDFGKGYSSLASLKRFPLDGLKIDKFFIESIDQDNEDASIAEALVKLARVRNLQVIAEGVEREQQVESLKRCGCDQYQGYFHSGPLKPEDFMNAFRVTERTRLRTDGL